MYYFPGSKPRRLDVNFVIRLYSEYTGLQLKCILQRVPIIINDLCDPLFDGLQAVCIVNELEAFFYVKGRPLLQDIL